MEPNQMPPNQPPQPPPRPVAGQDIVSRPAQPKAPAQPATSAPAQPAPAAQLAADLNKIRPPAKTPVVAITIAIIIFVALSALVYLVYQG